MLELGHRATVRDQVTAEGYTHDWCVFVRGPDSSAVDAFIDKVVFQLHESFPKPKRGERHWGLVVAVTSVVEHCNGRQCSWSRS